MLNHAQQEAVRVNGHAVITACPGSGKTTVLKHRAAFLLKTKPDSVLCGVTFTSESAAELDSRIRAEVQDAGTRVVCGTFHSLCKRQLTKAGHKFVLVNDLQQAELMKRAFFDTVEETKCSMDDAIKYIEHIKAQSDPILPLPKSTPIVLVYHRYQELLRQMGAMDFSDLLVECVRGMANGSVAPVTTENGIVTDMLVDEFQDTDEVQLAWVMEHVRQGAVVTIVGDDDQSVYGWRRALGFEGLNRFKKDTNATHIALNLTYRCSREIITHAAKLIVHNTERVEKSLETANKERGEVRVQRFNSRSDEVSGLMRAIILSGTPGDWGVLARTNAQLDEVEQALKVEEIRYVRSGGTSFWEMPAPALFLGVCQSLGAGDMIGVDDLLRKCGVSEGNISKIHKACNSKKAGALDRFLHGALATEPESKDKLGMARKRLAEWRVMIAKGEAKMAMEGLALFIRKNHDLKAFPMTPKMIARDQKMLEQCVGTLSKLSGNMQSRLATLRNFEKQNSDTKDGEAVRLMTLHSSKGLEFDRVWILGCEDGVLPSAKSPVEEERRLFFVGMTRAKRFLHLSLSFEKANDPSPFIFESGIR